jgi:hypothetical protein
MVPIMLPQVMADQTVGDVWEAWHAALVAAAPLLDKGTAERAILEPALAKAARREESVVARARACRLLPVAFASLRSDEEVRCPPANL